MNKDTNSDRYDYTAWLWGWDPMPGIVSLWVENDGTVHIWRRLSATAPLIYEREQMRPWILASSLRDLEQSTTHLHAQQFAIHALAGHGHLRYQISSSSWKNLLNTIFRGIQQRTGTRPASTSDLDRNDYLSLALDDQFLISSGRTFLRGLAFDDVHRLQFDLETTGLHPDRDAIFLVAIRDNCGYERIIDIDETGLHGPAAEKALIELLGSIIRARDPDVIENHNLFGFDLPFLFERAKRVHADLIVQRTIPHQKPYLAYREDAAVSIERSNTTSEANEQDDEEIGLERKRVRIIGRECIDTMDAVRRYDFSARSLPGHGLKAVAKHFGIAAKDRVYVEGAHIFSTWRADPDRVRHYALDDVREAAGVSQILGGAAFSLAQMAPRNYQQAASAGPATGILDPLLIRAYLHEGQSLPAHTINDGTVHTGAALYLFASGIARHIVKADVASLYPSLMRQYRIGPRSDHLGVFLAIVDQLVEQRLYAKRQARTLPLHAPERAQYEATSAAMKILVNAAYGYMGAIGLTRFADVTAANEVTRRGRQTLDTICRELAKRNVTLLEADTDGVYFAVPSDWNETAERSLVSEVAELLPPLVRLEYEGRYAAMFSHETKNYALLGYDGEVTLHGVAFRSIRFEPFGERFLRASISALLTDNIPMIRQIYLETAVAIEERTLPAKDLAVRARLRKSSKRYAETRLQKREQICEAMLNSGHTWWRSGEIVRFYRTPGKHWQLLRDDDARDYDVVHYTTTLHNNYAKRLLSAFSAEDWATLFASHHQLRLFEQSTDEIMPQLVMHQHVLE